MPHLLYTHLHSRSITDASLKFYHRSNFLKTFDHLLLPINDTGATLGKHDDHLSSIQPFEKAGTCIRPIAASVAGTWSQVSNPWGWFNSLLSNRPMSFNPFSPEEAKSVLMVSYPPNLPDSTAATGITIQPLMMHNTRTASPKSDTEGIVACKQTILQLLAIRPPKRYRTPFPSAHEKGVEDGSAYRKRSRTLIAVHQHTTPATETRAQETIFLPFVEWLTGHLFSLITIQNDIQTLPIHPPVQQMIIKKLLKILVHYRPKPTIIFLALWYLSRLFPWGLVSSCAFYGEELIEITTRVFLLGLTLANKWLNDFVIKNSTWTLFCSLPTPSINRIERCAMIKLGYNITISNGEWETWLVSLVESTSHFTSGKEGQLTAAAALCSVLSAAEKVHNGNVSFCTRPIVERPKTLSPETSCNLYTQILEDLPALNLVRIVREPAPWDPLADPIIFPRTRAIATSNTPGAPSYA